ncbi:MAG: tetratricopeptide repeat protein [Shimia sp.]
MGRTRILAAALCAVAISGGAQEAVADGLSGSYLAARAASKSHDFEAAAAHWLTALRYDQQSQAITEQALQAHVILGDFDKATVLAGHLASFEGANQIANLALTAHTAGEGQWDRLIAGIESGTMIGALVDGLVKGWAQVGAGETEAALATFEGVAENEGLRAFALYHKALALALVGDMEAAEGILSGHTHGAMAPNRRGGLARAQILSQMGRGDEAAAMLRALFEGQMLDARVRHVIARLEAGEVLPFDQVTSAQEGLAEVFYTVGAALKKETAPSYTLLYSRIAERLNPGHIDTLLLSAKLFEEVDQWDLATATYDRIPRDVPEYATAELGRAEALRKGGEPAAGLEVLRRLAESHGEAPRVYRTVGDVRRLSHDYDAAPRAYDAALALTDAPRPRQWFTYFARGISHERSDDWAAARADFEMALDLRPEQPQVLNYYGYKLTLRGERLDEALVMIETAAAAKPDNGHILDSLGWVLYTLGRYEEAVVPLEAAAELLATDPTVNDHLGDVYWAVGRDTEARFQWERALSFGPDEDEALRIRQKLHGAPEMVLLMDDEGTTRGATDG